MSNGRHGRHALAIVLAYALTSGDSALHAQAPPARLAAFLQQRVGLDSSRMAAIERAESVVKILDTQNSRDVAVFGIIRVDVPREFYVSRLQDFSSSLSAPTRPHFGVFHDPAGPADVAAATVAEQDVAQLKDCRPGACASKLPGTDMARIHDQIDWSSPDARSQLNAYLRQRLVQYVSDYRTRGDSALVVYDDEDGHVHASDAFVALLAQSPYIYDDIPSLRQYLASYPHTRLDGGREVLFWADDSTSGLRPILTANHLVLYAPPETPDATVLAVKQLYANHYFEAAFDLMAIVDRPSSPGASSGVYLVALRRFRFDKLPSGGVLNIRGRVVGKLRDQMRIDLERQKAVTESAFQRR
jgi:hypothetical protein